jgi:hypothetical protein
MQTFTRSLLAAVLLAGIALGTYAEDISAFSPSPLMLSPTDTSTPTFSPSAIMFIKDCAKRYGDQPSPNGTVYRYVNDYDLRGKSPDQIVQALSPTVNAGSGVRNIDIVVDLKNAISVVANGRQPVNIGTALITAPAHTNIDVRSDISVSNMKVIEK